MSAAPDQQRAPDQSQRTAASSRDLSSTATRIVHQALRARHTLLRTLVLGEVVAERPTQRRQKG